MLKKGARQICGDEKASKLDKQQNLTVKTLSKIAISEILH